MRLDPANRLLRVSVLSAALCLSLPHCRPPDAPLSSDEPDAGIIDDMQPAASDVRCTDKPRMAAGTSSRMMMSHGQKRAYYLHVPTGYDASRGTALVLAFHGLSDKAQSFMKYIDIEREADAQNVVAIIPQGLGVVPGWNAGNCCGEPQLFAIDDVGFARDLIKQAQNELCIDDHRIFAMGFSNGAMFSHRLGCELSSTLAAIAPVSGPTMVKDCKPEKSVAVLSYHGTADSIVGYEGGGSGSFPKISSVFADWAMRDRCSGMPEPTFKNGAVSCQSYRQCADGTEDTLCTIDKGQHTWPGSSDGTPDVKATVEILRFFARHPRP